MPGPPSPRRAARRPRPSPKIAAIRRRALYEAAVVHALNAVAIAGLDQRLVFANPACLRLWGYREPAEVIGRPAGEFWADPGAWVRVIKTLETAGHWGGVLAAKRADGSTFLAELAAVMVRDARDRPSWLMSSFIDVSAREQNAGELAQSHQLLDAVFDNTHVATAVLDTELNFLRVNRAYAAADGKSPDYFPGLNHFALYPHAENEVIFRRAVATGRPVMFAAKPFEYAHSPERGVTHWDWTLTPVRDATGRVTRLVLSLLDVTERIAAIETLSGREQELRALNDTLEERVQERSRELAAVHGFNQTVFDTLAALVVVLDRDGRIVRFNQACEQATGYRAEEAVGRRLWDFLIAPEELNAVRAVFDALADGHFPNQHESDWLARDGARQRIAWSNSCITAPDGTVEYIVATGVDVTLQRAAERALRSSEELFRQLAEHIQETFFVRDLATNRMVYVSPSYEKVWGRPAAALYAEPGDFLRSVHPDDLPRVVAAREDQYAGRGYFNMEYRVLRPDGEQRWVWVRTFPIPDEQGQVYRVAGLVQDLTERKSAEEALAASEQIFRQLADNVREVFWVVSPDRRRLYYLSPAFETVWGRPRADLESDLRLLFETVHPEDRPAILSEIETQAAGEYRDHYENEFRILLPDGTMRWIQSRYVPVRDDHGRVYRIAGVSEDITGRKQAESERLAQAEQQRDTLVREVHHCIKNNLQAVVGLLRDHADRAPAAGATLGAAIAQVNSIALVHGLMGRSGGSTVLLCDLIEAICRGASDLTRRHIDPVVERNVTAPVEIAEHESVPVALILNELVFNAVRHGAEEPVRVVLHAEGEAGEVRVINAGASLPPGFDFAAGRGLGTGLGLVKLLLPPKGAELTIGTQGRHVVARLTLQSPAVARRSARDPSATDLARPGSPD